MGLDGLLRYRAGVLTAILNGIDDTLWDPATDPWLTARFDARHLARRAPNKEALQARFGLDVERGRFVFGVVSRLTRQKGMDLLLDALPALVADGAQLALLGSGDKVLEDGFAAAARRAPGRIAAVIGYDEPLAHRVQGGVDALLIPSRFEPCGLTQLCALRYGAIPVVTRVGGLADTVIDANDVALATGAATGVQFAPVTRTMLELAIGRAHALWRDRASWQRLQAQAMATDVGWSRPARRYAALFRELVGGAAAAATSGAVRASARISSPSDQAWNGQPRGVCGASPSAISETCPSPASRRCSSSGARKRRALPPGALVLSPCARSQASTNGPISHGQTVPWW